MSLILDAGAFVALERGDRAMWRQLMKAVDAGRDVRTHGGVIAQVWRGGSGRQAQLARALRHVAIVPLGSALGRRTGLLLADSGTRDVLDAALVALAEHRDVIATSDIDDLQLLIAATGRAIGLMAT